MQTRAGTNQFGNPLRGNEELSGTEEVSHYPKGIDPDYDKLMAGGAC